MTDSQKLNEIYQAAEALYTDETFLNRIMAISDQQEQAKVLALGEIIFKAMNQPPTTRVGLDFFIDSDDVSEDFNRDPKIPYEYCETSDQFGY